MLKVLVRHRLLYAVFSGEISVIECWDERIFGVDALLLLVEQNLDGHNLISVRHLVEIHVMVSNSHLGIYF